MTHQKSERKNNKKTTVIIALLLALIAILSFGGYTLSKFVTSGGSTGKAQVAKWGYTMEIDGSNLFGKNYKFDSVASKVTKDTDGLTVKASGDYNGDYNVIAPGTTGSMTFTIGGQAEVKALIAMGITPEKDITLKLKKADGQEIVYNPVKWTLKKNGKVITGLENKTLIDVAGAFHDMTSNPVSSVKKPGEVLEETTYELIWAWAFEGTDTFTGITADELDTILGRCANDTSYASYGDWTIEKVCTKVEFKLDMQVTQLSR